MKINNILFIYKNDINRKAIVYNKYNSKKYLIPYKIACNPDQNVNELNSLSSTLEKKSYNKLQHLRLLITNKCNLDCIYCYANGGSYNQELKDMSKDVLKRTIDFFYSKYDYINQISFFGGEPLINVSLIEYACDYINEFCSLNNKQLPKYSIVTNGTLINNRALKLIDKYKIAVNVSIDGPKSLNDSQRKYKNTNNSVFDDVDKGLVQLRKIQSFSIEATCSIKINDFNLNYKDIEYFLRDRYSVSRVNVSSILAIDHVNKELKIAEEENRLVSLVDNFFSVNENFTFNDIIIKLLNIYFSDYFCSSFCDAGLTQFTVIMNGDIYPCQLFVNNNENILGNVFNITKQDLQIHEKKYEKNNEKCQICPNIRFCQTCLRTLHELDENYCKMLNDGVNKFLCYMLELKLCNQKKYQQLIKELKYYYDEYTI